MLTLRGEFTIGKRLTQSLISWKRIIERSQFIRFALWQVGPLLSLKRYRKPPPTPTQVDNIRFRWLINNQRYERVVNNSPTTLSLTLTNTLAALCWTKTGSYPKAINLNSIKWFCAKFLTNFLTCLIANHIDWGRDLGGGSLSKQSPRPVRWQSCIEGEQVTGSTNFTNP